MKKKRFYSGCAAAAALLMGTILTGCSSDETIEGGESPVVHNAAISYGVGVNGKLTRGVSLGASDVANSALLPNMQVFAYYHPNASGFGATPGTQYVGAGGSGITVTNTGGVWKEDAANTAYWPAESAPLNFQAIAPASDASFIVTNSVSDNLAHMVANVTVPTVNADQKDILMANEDKVTQSTHGRSVRLDFKHVLSQARFKVQTASKQLSGNIGAISLCNIKSTGSVGYHTADDVADGTNDWKKVVLGVAVADDAVASYAIGMGDGSFGTAQFGAGNAKDVTAADGSLMMLPQTTSKWTTVDGNAVTIAAADAAKNTYIKISCKILNGNTYLVGSENTYGEVYIPFAANWTMGKKYIYTINIGTGTGGFDVNGKPLIQPISYSVDVDEWGDAVNGDVPQPEPAAESTAVDLGLPSGLKWAAGNIGADNPEDYGLYFAWGETTGYTAEQVENGERVFDEASYTASAISADLTLAQDAARANLGGIWRMPTDTEFQELIDNCDGVWTKNYNRTGVAGMIFTSKVNGNSVFFPAAGDCSNSSVDDVGVFGGYWSASWNSSSFARYLYFDSGRQYVYDDYRCCGYSVRGVCE